MQIGPARPVASCSNAADPTRSTIQLRSFMARRSNGTPIPRLSHGFYNRPMTWLVTAALMLAISLPSPSPAQQPSPDVVAQAARGLAAIAADEFAKVEDQFTAEMKAALPARPAGGDLDDAADSGRRATRAAARTRESGRIADKQMVITPCEFERATIDIQFAFDSAGRISGLVVPPGRQAAGALHASVIRETVILRRDAR